MKMDSTLARVLTVSSPSVSELSALLTSFLPSILTYFHPYFLPSLLTSILPSFLPSLLLSNRFVGELSFCFIYKFRQRFGAVANPKALAYNHSPTASSNPSHLTLTIP